MSPSHSIPNTLQTVAKKMRTLSYFPASLPPPPPSPSPSLSLFPSSLLPLYSFSLLRNMCTSHFFYGPKPLLNAYHLLVTSLVCPKQYVSIM